MKLTRSCIRCFLKYLVDMFKADETFGQLIYTGHDTSFLDIKFMRRDQIWIIEKNAAGESEMFSISEF